jgi:hypothetical protein
LADIIIEQRDEPDWIICFCVFLLLGLHHCAWCGLGVIWF